MTAGQQWQEIIPIISLRIQWSFLDAWNMSRIEFMRWAYCSAYIQVQGKWLVQDTVSYVIILTRKESTHNVLAGSLDYEVKDARSFAKWGVDYLKYDNCFNKGRFGTPVASFQRYEVMWTAINATGRPMLYSLCNWGEDYTHAVNIHMSPSFKLTYDSGQLQSQIHTECQGMCMTSSLDQTICVAATTLQTHIVLHLGSTALSWLLSTDWRHLQTGRSRERGPISTCLK